MFLNLWKCLKKNQPHQATETLSLPPKIVYGVVDLSDLEIFVDDLFETRRQAQNHCRFAEETFNRPHRVVKVKLEFLGEEHAS